MSESTTTTLAGYLVRMNAGDREALNLLLGRVYERLERLARHMLRDYQRLRSYADTGDVLQGSLQRLVRALESVKPESLADFFRLAAQQMRRELIDLTRHYYGPQGEGTNQVPLANASPSGTGLPEAADDSTFDPAQLEMWREFHEQVERLPVEERTVFELLWYHGWRREDAAELLQISVATVQRRYTAARLRLGRLVQDPAAGS
jgi:RNA polymerase sigma-70 factor (ECF subfamily)